jgi:tetratricopeptide (TPR) repeat protein
MAHRFRPFRWQAGQLRLILEVLTAPAADRPRWLTILLWFAIPTMLLIPIGVSFWAVTDLFGLPALPQCLTVSWSDDNFTSRLYCAKINADRRTPQDLRQAIELVSHVPRTDPLRPESDRLIQQWSDDLLRLGEAKYQDGNLDEAIEIAEKIPDSVHTRRMAEDRIQQWKDTWDKANTLSEDAKQRLNDKDWYGVLATARQLLTLGNRYWATTQYEELMRQLQAAKDNDQGKNKPKPTSDRSRKTAPGVPEFLSQLQQEQATDASAHLSKAKSLASTGTAEGLQSAINEAQQVVFGTEGYDEAQVVIDRWRHQLEVSEDQPILDRALALAKKGDEASLQAAITEASQIGWGRTLYDQANGYAEQWRDRVFQLQSESRTRQLEEMQRGGSFPETAPRSIPEVNPSAIPRAVPETTSGSVPIQPAYRSDPPRLNGAPAPASSP